MIFCRILSNYFFHFIISLLIIHSECNNKYCSSNICDGNKQHTLCRFPTAGRARHCVDYERTINSDSDRQGILHRINVRRNKVASGEIRSLPSAQNMLKMVWNKELEESAQRWADQCVTHRHSTADVLDACRDLESMPVGQNIATVYGDAPGLTPMSLVDVWFMELLNLNSSILSQYHSYNDSRPSYKYFTQLVWAESYQVGCGGVKFKERSEDLDKEKNRTVYRLVCNFGPRGNKDGKTVYKIGPPGTNCTLGTCKRYPSLCYTKQIGMRTKHFTEREQVTTKESTTHVSEGDINSETSNGIVAVNSEVTIAIDGDMDNTTFDYFSHLYEFTKAYLTRTTATTPKCKKNMEFNEILEILKRKLNDDPTLKDLFTATSALPTGDAFKQASVEDLLLRIYSKTAKTTTQETPNADFVNSTLLVNLVEAVIFRNADGSKSSEKVTQEIQLRPHFVSPLRAQPAVPVTVAPNFDVTGHYFFPEDNIEDDTKETTEPDYDLSYAPSMEDVVHELEEIRKNRPTKDFLYEILETESVMESSTKMQQLSPDDMNLYTGGYSNMKNFLKEIAEKTTFQNDEILADL